MKRYLLLIVLAGCGTPGGDLFTPDELSVWGSGTDASGSSSMGRIGQPWTLDGANDARAYTLGAGLTWYLDGDQHAEREALREIVLELRAMRQTPVPVVPVEEEEPEVEAEDVDTTKTVTAALSALAIAVAAYLGRRHIPIVKKFVKGKGDEA